MKSMQWRSTIAIASAEITDEQHRSFGRTTIDNKLAVNLGS